MMLALFGVMSAQAATVRVLQVDGVIGPASADFILQGLEDVGEVEAVVIALDTPFEPADVADATFATDNFKAGELIGQWAAAKMGDDAANAKIALLDLNASEISVDYLRDNGFLHGFGRQAVEPVFCRLQRFFKPTGFRGGLLQLELQVFNRFSNFILWHVFPLFPKREREYAVFRPEKPVFHRINYPHFRAIIC